EPHPCRLLPRGHHPGASAQPSRPTPQPLHICCNIKQA
ncbi:hypothetical protein BN1723_019557, partial [Verticillium longisporum]